MVDPIRPYEKYRSWIENLASKGMGADRIYRDIRDFFKLGTGERSPVPRSFVREVAPTVRRQTLENRRTFPTRSNAILDERRAVKLNIRSPLGNRFHIQFTFDVINPITGQRRTVTNTIGSPEGLTLGEVRAIAQNRLMRLNNKDFLFDSERLAQIQREDEIADLSSIKFVNLFELLV